MKSELKEEPRLFEASGVTIKDYGKVHLHPQEMVSLVSTSGRECDLTAMDWGFYLAPSLNARLRNQGFKVALVVNLYGKLFINAVEMDKIPLFEKYLTTQESKIICWLDDWEVN